MVNQSQFIEMFGGDLQNRELLISLQELIDKNWITYHLDGNHGGDYPRGEEFVESGVPYISANCIEDHLINWEKAKYLTKERATLLKKGLAHNNDVLFAHNATVGPVAILHTADDLVILGTSLTAYRCNAEFVLPEYLLAYMDSPVFRAQYEAGMQQSTRNQVPITTQRSYKFLIPPMTAQRTYSAVFQQADKSKFAGFKSQFIEMFDSHSESFKRCPISDLCHSNNDIKCGPFGTQLKQAEYTDHGVPVWGIPQINSGFTMAPDVFVSEEKAQQLEQFSLIPEDIAMSRKGNVGMCALYPDSYEDGIIASDVVRIRVNKEKIIPHFLVYQLHNSHQIRKQILEVSDGTVMAGINVTKMKSIIVYCPDINSQQKFKAILGQTDKSKYLN